MIGKVCHACLARCEKLYRCSICRFSRYCGKHCQVARPHPLHRKAWGIHKIECPRLQKNSGRDCVFETVRLLGRTIDKLDILKANNEDSPIRELLANPHDTLHPEWESEMRLNTYSFFQTYMGCAMDEDLLDQLIGQYRRNGFGLLDDVRVEKAAIALFSKFSLFNHSCCPNVYVSNVGTTLRARAIRPISQGEELTMNYVEDLMLETIEYRRERLRVRYLFECTCPACTSPEAIEKNKIHTNLRVKTSRIDVSQCIEECQKTEAAARAQANANNHAAVVEILDKFIQSCPLDRRSCYIRKMASLAQASFFQLHLLERTLEFGDIVTQSMKAFLSSDDVKLAQHYLSLCASLVLLNRWKEAARLTQIAVRSYKAFLGEEHPTTKAFQRD
ncbi:N-lysine methyltransferase SMYD2-like [Oscarella lobularis]|uniref:N-lysine methyltransferase SMYD2-like n=1 Tax=Oscarella lobularis TaxID=121494 RepID=UPI0033135E55